MTLEEIKVRYDGIQSRLKYIHEYGCLFLCLCEIIEEVTNAPCDIIRVVQESKARGWLEEDYTVSNSLAILNTFTKKEWKRKEVEKLPAKIKDNEFTIEKWYNPRTKYTHFKRRFVDTLVSSVTVKEGKIKEYYIYYY